MQSAYLGAVLHVLPCPPGKQAQQFAICCLAVVAMLRGFQKVAFNEAMQSPRAMMLLMAFVGRDAVGRQRSPVAVAWSLQRYLIFAILSCVPDRQRTLRELEVGRNLFKEKGR